MLALWFVGGCSGGIQTYVVRKALPSKDAVNAKVHAKSEMGCLSIYCLLRTILLHLQQIIISSRLLHFLRHQCNSHPCFPYASLCGMQHAGLSSVASNELSIQLRIRHLVAKLSLKHIVACVSAVLELLCSFHHPSPALTKDQNHQWCHCAKANRR